MTEQEKRLASGSNWRKAGIMKCSYKSEVVLISIFDLGFYKWLIVGKKELEDLLKGFRFQIDVKEHV
jgi:hypothetical protein